MFYYCARDGGFYSEAVHGPFKIKEIDPAFVWPMIEVENPNHANDVNAPETIEVRDVSVQPPMIEVDNPDCMIPVDVIPVSDEQHADLFSAQGCGKIIVPGRDGFPVAIDPVVSDGELAERVRSERDARLAACDWVVIRAHEMGQQVAEPWRVYRNALRDVPTQPGFPRSIAWPVPPAA